MNIKLVLQPKDFTVHEVWWGGTFSQFMIMLPNLLPYDDVENIYFDVLYPYNELPRKGDFNSVFDQYYDDSFKEVICQYYGNYTRDGKSGLGDVEKSRDFDKLKSFCSKIRIRKELRKEIDDFANTHIGNTLGVHVRTGDMNFFVPEYGTYHTSDYLKRIKEIFRQGSFDNIFVASDNEESLEILGKEFAGKIAFLEELVRERWEDFKTPVVHQPYIPRIWEEGFKEMLLLSRCSELLCRTSNVATSAILFSDMITKVHRL